MGGEELPAKTQITFGKFQNVDLRVARVVSAPLAEGVRFPCRVLTLDLGHLGSRTSVGQFALLAESDLVGKHVVACVNLSHRAMGPHTSEALVLGAPHPKGPSDEAQATPLFVAGDTTPGASVY